MLSRFAYYFDEVARLGSIRKAAEVLHIAASAIDRQILQAEERLGTPLFERLPQGLRLTAAGELMIHAIRRWRRDYDRISHQIDDMRGLRRGKINVAVVEGASEFAAGQLSLFRQQYQNIGFRIIVAGSSAVAELVISGECEVGLTFNPPQLQALRVEEYMIFQVGAVIPAGHDLGKLAEVRLIDCADYPMIVPDHSLSLRAIIDSVWARTMGHEKFHAIEVNNIALMKSFVRRGEGVGLLTRMDVLEELQSGEFCFKPLDDDCVPHSVLTLVAASGRSLSPPAALLKRSLVKALLELRSEQTFATEEKTLSSVKPRVGGHKSRLSVTSDSPIP